jgi:O-antigen biosynthesis protein
MNRLALNKIQHPESLERLCTAALSCGDFATAFMYADRRCRILPFPKSHHFALRAEALIRLGDREGAIADILAALELSPDDVHCNRRMLTWGDAAQKIVAAASLVTFDDDAAVLHQALAVLRNAGREAVGAARVVDDTITGWAAWNGSDAPIMSLMDQDSETSIRLTARRDHPLCKGAFDKVAEFQVRRNESIAGHRLSLALGDAVFLRQQCQPNASSPPPAQSARTPKAAGVAGITVIVPVYRDFAATRNCLESLAPEVDGAAGRQAIIVNDATPEPELAAFLLSFCARDGFSLLNNRENLGFVGSVNRALALVASDDVVLLNADTIVPPGCIDRLSEIARADPTIGTVTPISNNGEFTSFPIPFQKNRMPAQQEIVEIDRIAAESNRGVVVDLPNGIGFCMLISRRCLDAVGGLSKAYQRGYLEDVDFCLRAREHGFRNVCAPSIYVGHLGSRSFGAEKRSLVQRNIAVAEMKFPDYRRECALFMTADPLRASREAIEHRMAPPRGDRRLLVCGQGLLSEVAHARAQELRDEGEASLVLSVDQSEGGPVLTIRNPDGAVPQSLRFRLDRLRGFEDLRKYLRSILVNAIEIVEPAAASIYLMRLLAQLGRPIHLLAADAGMLCPRGSLVQPDGQFCTALDGDSGSQPCISLCRTAVRDRSDYRERWKAVSGGEINLPCDEAEPFAAVLMTGTIPPARVRSSNGVAVRRALTKRIGLVTQGRSTQEFGLLQAFLRASVARCPAQEFIVIGATADDLALMAVGNNFVSGEVDAADHRKVMELYDIDRIFLPLRRPLFGHSSCAAALRSGLPLAYFDWSFGQREPRAGDLALDPRLGLDEFLPMLGQWGGF